MIPTAQRHWQQLQREALIADGLSGSYQVCGSKFHDNYNACGQRKGVGARKEDEPSMLHLCVHPKSTHDPIVDVLKGITGHVHVWSDAALGTRNWARWRNVQTTSSPEASGAAVGSQELHSLFSQTSISVWTARPPKGPCEHSSSLCKSKTTVRTLPFQRSMGGEKVSSPRSFSPWHCFHNCISSEASDHREGERARRPKQAGNRLGVSCWRGAWTLPGMGGGTPSWGSWWKKHIGDCFLLSYDHRAEEERGGATCNTCVCDESEILNSVKKMNCQRGALKVHQPFTTNTSGWGY